MSEDLDRLQDALRSKYWSWVFYDPSDSPQTLLELLTTRLPHIDSESWNERLEWGGVFINGYPAESDCALPFPVKVEYYEPKFELDAVDEVFPKFDPKYVVYADDDMAVVYKPAKLPSMPAREQKHFSLKAALDQHFGRTIHMPSRLDVSAQGLVAVSLSERMHSVLQQAFEHRKVQKEYLLATHVKPEWSGVSVIGAIDRDPRHPVLRRVVPDGGQSACTTFLYKEKKQDGHHLIFAYPKSGRTHQIRVHSSFLGIPIVGDNFYNGAEGGSLCLLSCAVSIFHPFKGELISVKLPEELIPVWARF